MSTTDPMSVLQSLAPWVPDDAEELTLARAQCDRARAAESGACAERVRRPARRVRWLVAAAAVAGIGVGAVLWPGPGQSAFASWTPTATVATSDQVDAAQMRCDAALAGATEQIAADEEKFGVRLPNAPTSAAQLAGRTALLAEQRGDFTFVLSTNGMWTVGCLAAPGMSQAMTEATTVDLSLHPATLTPDGIDTLGAGSEGVTDGASAVLAYGRVGADVTAVDVTAVDGRIVHATVIGGYWSAWWPAAPDELMGDAQVMVRLVDGTSLSAGTLDRLNDSSTTRR